MKVAFLGTGDIGLPSLAWLLGAPGVITVAVVTQPDRASGRGMAVHAPRVKELASARGVPVFQPGRIREDHALARVAMLQPDLLVVMAYGQILPQALLDVPAIGALNLHASLLPRHRGAAPVQAAILSGDRSTGVTSMWMDAGLDTGDILLRREIAIGPDETAGSLHDRLADLAPTVLADSLRLIREGRAPRQPQEAASATYAPKLSRHSGQIDWSNSAEEIARQVRGLHPWPGSTAELLLAGGRTTNVKVHRARAIAGLAPPGQITAGLGVGCAGGGILEILELQAPGRRVLPAAEFLRGQKVLGAVVSTRRQQQQQAQQ